MKLRLFVAGVLGLVVIVGAIVFVSSGSANAGQAAQTLTVKMADLSFGPDTITLKAGQPVTIELENDDSMVHAFSIDTLNVQSDVIGAHQASSVTFTPAQAGTYQFYCPMPGHVEYGMIGTLQVVS